MTNINTQKVRSFKYIISKNKIAMSINNLLQKIFHTRNNRYKKTTTPILISLHIPNPSTNVEYNLIKSFMKNLEKLPSNYFVRFITELYWINEFDLKDYFYTFDGDTRDISNVVFKIEFDKRDYISIITTLYNQTDVHTYLNSISIHANNIVKAIPVPSNKDDYQEYMETIRTSLFNTRHIKHMDCNIQFIMINDIDYSGKEIYYFIPLIGISHVDSARIYDSEYRNLMKAYSKFSYIAKENQKPDNGMLDILSILIDLIRSNERLPQKLKRNTLTYRLAEIIHGYLSTHIDDDKLLTIHDLVIFSSYINAQEEESTRISILDMDEDIKILK